MAASDVDLPRLAVFVVDGALAVAIAWRLIWFKRKVDEYRPPSPLPPNPYANSTLTITRVS